MVASSYARTAASGKLRIAVRLCTPAAATRLKKAVEGRVVETTASGLEFAETFDSRKARAARRLKVVTDFYALAATKAKLLTARRLYTPTAARRLARVVEGYVLETTASRLKRVANVYAARVAAHREGGSEEAHRGGGGCGWSCRDEGQEEGQEEGRRRQQCRPNGGG